jgi:putative effector of murein hydrolase LrgA (UPF0299 family)
MIAPAKKNPKKVKAWIKKQARLLFSLLCLFFIGMLTISMMKTHSETIHIFAMLAIAIWSGFFLMASGVIDKLIDWWEDD